MRLFRVKSNEGSPSSIESIDDIFGRECLDAELIQSLAEFRFVIEYWRRLYRYEWPRSALGYQTSAAVFDGAIIRKI